jgi:hypothetical protein
VTQANGVQLLVLHQYLVLKVLFNQISNERLFRSICCGSLYRLLCHLL